MGNFKEIVEDATAAKASRLVMGATDLTHSLVELMDTPKIAQEYTKRATQFLTQQTKVLGTILKRLSPYLGKDKKAASQQAPDKAIEANEPQEGASERA